MRFFVFSFLRATTLRSVLASGLVFLLTLGFTEAREGRPAKQTIQPLGKAYESDGEIRQRLAQSAADWIREGALVSMAQLQSQLGKTRCEIPVSTRSSAISSRRKNWLSTADVARGATLIVAGVFKSEPSKTWEVSTSTGFLIDASGVFVTCRHVFLHDEYEGMVVMTGDGKVHRVIEVLASSEEDDVAIGRIEGVGHPAFTLRDGIQVGEEVGVMSHPHGQFFTFSKGSVTRTFRVRDNGVWVDAVAIDAEFGPGSSGAPVMDDRGRVVAVAESIQMRTPRPGEPASYNPPMIFRRCRPISRVLALIQSRDRVQP